MLGAFSNKELANLIDNGLKASKVLGEIVEDIFDEALAKNVGKNYLS